MDGQSHDGSNSARETPREPAYYLPYCDDCKRDSEMVRLRWMGGRLGYWLCEECEGQ